MRNHVCLILLAIALLIQSNVDAAKVTDVVIEYINPKYIETKLMQVKVNKDNDDGSSIDLVTRVVKDFPQDTKVSVKLYLVNAENKKLKTLYSTRIPLCKQDADYDYLPSFFKLIKNRSKCIEKGQYQIKNIKDFNYSNLVPDLDKKGQFFKLEFTVYSFWAGKILKGYSLIKAVQSNEESVNYPQQHQQQQQIQHQPQQEPQLQPHVSENNYASANNNYHGASNYAPVKNYGQVGAPSSGGKY